MSDSKKDRIAKLEADLAWERAQCGKLRKLLAQCHNELANAWGINIESVEVELAERRGGFDSEVRR